jgi:hypothetical protein
MTDKEELRADAIELVETANRILQSIEDRKAFFEPTNAQLAAQISGLARFLETRLAALETEIAMIRLEVRR